MDSVLVKHNSSDQTSRRSIARPFRKHEKNNLFSIFFFFLLHGERKRCSHKLETLILGHSWTVIGIAISIHINRSRSAECKALLHQRSSHGDGINLTTFDGVPATANDSSRQRVLSNKHDLNKKQKSQCDLTLFS